jgi:hypothetical protein
MLGCCAPNRNLIEPSEPATGLMPVADLLLPTFGDGERPLFPERSASGCLVEILVGQVARGGQAREGDRHAAPTIKARRFSSW